MGIGLAAFKMWSVMANRTLDATEAKVGWREHPRRAVILLASALVHLIRDLPKETSKKDHSEISELVEGQSRACYRCCHRGMFSTSLK